MKYIKMLCCISLLALSPALYAKKSHAASHPAPKVDTFTFMVDDFTSMVDFFASQVNDFTSKVDFFTSMEWYLEKNRFFKEKYFLANTARAKEMLETYHILKGLYDKNDFSQKVVQGERVIPKIIHQVWVGPNNPPTIFKESQKSIQKYHPDWEYRLWTDADIPEFKLQNQKFYDLSNNYGEKADILRYEILYRYGGVYLDADFVCLKPLDILSQYDVWASIQPIDCGGDINNAVIGTIPEHPILKDCIDTLEDDWNTFHDKKNNLCVFDVAGPRHFQRSFMKFVKEGMANLIAVPRSFFYPLDHKDRLLGLNNHSNENDEEINSLIKPECFAMHYWAGSWWGDKKNEKILGML
ncbi:hypothetical protein H0W26_05355 [Candidatus Dependentiae bacterium]|nr:hypothetical protein [Candidatus Dependentiae bacterium]